MTTNRFFHFATLLTLLFLAACNGVRTDIQPTPTLISTAVPIDSTTATDPASNTDSSASSDAVAPTDTPPPTAAAAAAEPTLNLNVSSLEPTGLGGYRVDMEFRAEQTDASGNTTLIGRTFATGARTINPAASDIVFTAEGGANLGQGNSFNLTYVDDANYVVLPDGTCFALFDEANLTNPYTLLIGAGGMLGTLDGAERVLPNQTYEGFEVEVYQFDETILNPADPTAGEVALVSGTVYVTVGAQIPLYLQMTGRGVSELLGATTESDIFYELRFYDIGSTNVQITIPESCSGAAESEFPVFPGGEVQTSANRLFVYTVDAVAADVVDFYKAEMPAAGWTLTGEQAAGPATNLDFSMNGRSVMIIIAPNPTGGLQVAITSQ